MNHRRLIKWSQRGTVAAGLTGMAFVAYVIYTEPAPYTDPVNSKVNICIVEDDAGYVPFGTPHDELFPVGYVYGKDGEIVNMDQPGSASDPASTTEDHNDRPVPWIEQSLTGQSPPVLFWPAPKQILKKADKPCTDRYKPVPEPGILTLIGAALLAIVVTL